MQNYSGGKVTCILILYYVYLDVGIKDEGMYVCVAQNQFGTTEATGYLTVTGIGKQGY